MLVPGRCSKFFFPVQVQKLQSRGIETSRNEHSEALHESSELKEERLRVEALPTGPEKEGALKALEYRTEAVASKESLAEAKHDEAHAAASLSVAQEELDAAQHMPAGPTKVPAVAAAKAQVA